MKKILMFFTVIFTAIAQAEIPSLVECTNPDGKGKIIFHRFEFRQKAEEVFPPRYEIRIFSSLLTPSENPDTPVKSEDPLPPQEIIMDETYTGSRDANDADLIYFAKKGFIRIDRVSHLSDFAMTFQPPDQAGEIAQFVENCRLPEPRGGVGN